MTLFTAENKDKFLFKFQHNGQRLKIRAKV